MGVLQGFYGTLYTSPVCVCVCVYTDREEIILQPARIDYCQVFF